MTTLGTFAMELDGSTVGLTGSSEDIDAVAAKGAGLYLSTTGSFSVSGFVGHRRGRIHLRRRIRSGLRVRPSMKRRTMAPSS
jgi:hypothetical protein